MKLEKALSSEKRSGTCCCPICFRKLVGTLILDEHVWLTRCCPEHGYSRTLLFASSDYFVRAQTAAAVSSPERRHRCLVVEVTERCDVGCATCSASSTVMGAELPTEEVVQNIQIAAVNLQAEVVALSGGEPLMRKDLWQIADELHQTVPKVVLITSGRGFETNQSILEEIAIRSSWLEIYLQFDSLNTDVLRKLRIKLVTPELRRNRLRLAVSTGAATSAVCVVSPDTTKESIGELTKFCRDEGASGITFQPLRRLGRHPLIDQPSSPMSAIDYIQNCALVALGIDATPQPFIQQPFDISATFVIDNKALPSDFFFLKEKQEKIFRVATYSYWDSTNYFSLLNASEPYYFYISEGAPLSSHYFNNTITQRAEMLLDTAS